MADARSETAESVTALRSVSASSESQRAQVKTTSMMPPSQTVASNTTASDPTPAVPTHPRNQAHTFQDSDWDGIKEKAKANLLKHLEAGQVRTICDIMSFSDPRLIAFEPPKVCLVDKEATYTRTYPWIAVSDFVSSCYRYLTVLKLIANRTGKRPKHPYTYVDILQTYLAEELLDDWKSEGVEMLQSLQDRNKIFPLSMDPEDAVLDWIWTKCEFGRFGLDTLPDTQLAARFE